MPIDVTVRIRIGGRGGPAFLATGAPTISWQVDTSDADWRQAGAAVEIERGGVRTEHRFETDASQHIPWPADPLVAFCAARVRVRLRSVAGVWTEPSEWMPIETGPLRPEDWRADLIAVAAEPGDDRATARFRKVLRVRPGLRRALLSLTSHGVHDATINGAAVDDVVLAPGWTAYDQRLLFRTVDVTGSLHEGDNVLSATVGEGWYRERYGFDGAFSVAYPGPVAYTAQLRLTFDDGTVETVPTDGSWSATSTGPVVFASIYQGEHVDARLEDRADLDVDAELPGARPAVVVPFDRSVLAPLAAPPIRRIERLAVQDVITTPSGRTVLDFGQNLVGWLEFELDLPAGTELVLRHAEVLEHGELGTRPLRHAAATDRYVAGGGPVTWSPRFTFHGFRYAEVSGAVVDATGVTAVVVHSDLEPTGDLTTDAPLLDRLHQNVVWGMRGNFVGIPSDCPQRDERLGWTGDIQVFAPTASFLYDVDAFLGSWLTDLRLQQSPDGAVPLVVPSPLPGPPPVTAAWGDAAVLVPDTLHERFGDPAVLERQYESMRAWVGAVRARAGEDLLWTGYFQFGDWLDPTAPPHNPAAARTDGDLVATAYFFHSTRRLASAARVLGRHEEAVAHDELADRIGAAFRRAYVTPAGRVLSDAHTAYALVIAFGLVEGEQRDAAGRRLAELVRAHGYRIRTGFVGTPLIADALSATGHLETAYRLLTERGTPSWLHPVTMGATTIWERWDSMLPDGTINPGEMTSFNHYALGAVADWMHRTIGGIAPAAPGYRELHVAPSPGGGVTRASAELETGYGRVATSWRVEERVFRLDVVVPVGVTATVVLPDGTRHEGVTHGAHEFATTLPAGAERPAPGMGSTLAELVDDPAARAALEAFFVRSGYFIGLGWTESGRWRSDTRLRDALLMMNRAQRDDLDQVLAALQLP